MSINKLIDFSYCLSWLSQCNRSLMFYLFLFLNQLNSSSSVPKCAFPFILPVVKVSRGKSHLSWGFGLWGSAQQHCWHFYGDLAWPKKSRRKSRRPHGPSPPAAAEPLCGLQQAQSHAALRYSKSSCLRGCSSQQFQMTITTTGWGSRKKPFQPFSEAQGVFATVRLLAKFSGSEPSQGHSLDLHQQPRDGISLNSINMHINLISNPWKYLLCAAPVAAQLVSQPALPPSYKHSHSYILDMAVTSVVLRMELLRHFAVVAVVGNSFPPPKVSARHKFTEPTSSHPLQGQASFSFLCAHTSQLRPICMTDPLLPELWYVLLPL